MTAILSKKILEYIAAIYELAKEYRKDKNNYINVKNIAENHNISKTYLLELLSDLKQRDLVESTRGSKGGFRLKKHPNKITILEIIEAIKGSYEISTNLKESEPLSLFWKDFEEVIRVKLSITLDEVMKKYVALSFDI
jgi:Rrf2 family protein